MHVHICVYIYRQIDRYIICIYIHIYIYIFIYVYVDVYLFVTRCMWAAYTVIKIFAILFFLTHSPLLNSGPLWMRGTYSLSTFLLCCVYLRMHVCACMHIVYASGKAGARENRLCRSTHPQCRPGMCIGVPVYHDVYNGIPFDSDSTGEEHS